MMRALRYLWHDYWKSLNLLCKVSKRSRLYLALDIPGCMIFQLTLPSEYCDYGYDFLPRRKRKDYFSFYKRKRVYNKLQAPRSRAITANKLYSHP